LVERNYEYIFLGPLCQRSLYSKNERELGSRFLENIVPVDFPAIPGEKLILTPEGTYGTTRQFLISGKTRGKFFYSEEFVRNEPMDEVENGKTRAFWQIGFEIFGFEGEEAKDETVATIAEVMKAVGMEATLLISDKRILQGATENLTQDMEEITRILECISNGQPIAYSDIRMNPEPYMLRNRLEWMISSSELSEGNLFLEAEKVFSRGKMNFALIGLKIVVLKYVMYVSSCISIYVLYNIYIVYIVYIIKFDSR